MTLVRPVKERIVGRAAPPMCIAAKHSALCNRPACLPACSQTLGTRLKASCRLWCQKHPSLWKVVVYCNIKPGKMRGLESQAWAACGSIMRAWHFWVCVCHFYCWEGRVVFFSAAFCKVQAMVLAATKNKGEKDTVLVNAGLLSPDVRKQ